MVAIITTDTRIFNADNFIESFSEKSKDFIYMFIGRSAEWTPDDSVPDALDFSTSKELEMYDNMIAAKLVSPAQIRPITRRFDWASGTYYEPYDDTVDVLEYTQSPASVSSPIYVMTDDARVYKCLDVQPDGTGTVLPSTVKPTSTDSSPFQTADGYIWKYMYSLTLGEIQNFMTTNFMPCRTVRAESENQDQWRVQVNAISGALSRIVMTDTGTGYTSPTVTITGDGTGATATAHVVSGEIVYIELTNRGTGYTYANVSIVEGINTTASARACVSPVGGHGSDPRKELGAVYVMVRNTFSGQEGLDFPISGADAEFRQVGLVVNPVTTANGLQLSVILPKFDVNIGDVLFSGTSGGEVVGWDYTYNKVILKNKVGYNLLFSPSQILTRLSDGKEFATIASSGGINTTKVPATEQTYSKSELTQYRGKIIYIENRTAIQRSVDQTEEVKLILEF